MSGSAREIALRALDLSLQVYLALLVATAVISWLHPDRDHPAVRFLRGASDPLVRRLRPLLPSSVRYLPLDVAFAVLVLMVVALRGAVQAAAR